ncbi:MAG: pilus assembly FimT family protein [Terrimicrobiaceae bacterium]
MTISGNKRAHTLLEVLLALGVVAVLLGITIPYVADSFGKTQGEEISGEMAKAVQAVRSRALEKGEARKFAILENGIRPDIDSVKAVQIPAGWKLEIRRMTESKFRKPAKQEFWIFNGAGICEPVTFKIRGPKESVELLFDPLTGLLIDE